MHLTSIRKVDLHASLHAQSSTILTYFVVWWIIDQIIHLANMGFLYDQLVRRLPYPTTPQTGKTFIVTGANIGLGLEAARHLVQLGAKRVILAVRSLDKGEEAREYIDYYSGKKGVAEVWKLDLGSYASVQAFAKKAQSLDRLDGVIENAAIATKDYAVVEDNEVSITVNVVSTFLLALLLLPKLRDTACEHNVRPSLVVISSGVHAWPKFEERNAPDGQILATLNDKEKTNMAERYPVTKLLEVLFVRELCARIAEKHPGAPEVIINLVNPGLCHSALARNAGWGLAVAKFFLARSSEVGSRTEIHALIDAGKASHGGYLSNCELDEVSPFVQSKEGEIVAKRVYKEVMDKLEKIHPGVSANV